MRYSSTPSLRSLDSSADIALRSTAKKSASSYDIPWSLTHANEYSKINAMYGGCNYQAVNWETSEEAYTTVQYEQFAKAFDAAIQG